MRSAGTARRSRSRDSAEMGNLDDFLGVGWNMFVGGDAP